MCKGFVLKGIAFLAGAILFSSFAPSGVHAEHYVSKHDGDRYSGDHHSRKDPWIDIDIVNPQPARIEYHKTVQHRYYNDYDDDRYEYRDHKRYKKHHHYSRPHQRCCPPQGWYTRVKRGYVIPSDIYEYREPVPQRVLVTMQPQPPGVVHIMIGGKVIRLVEATRTIMDVFDM